MLETKQNEKLLKNKKNIINKTAQSENSLKYLLERNADLKNKFYFKNLTDDCFFDITGPKKSFTSFYNKIIKSGVDTIILGGIYLGINEQQGNNLARLTLNDDIMSSYKEIVMHAHSAKCKIYLQIKSVYGRHNHLYNINKKLKTASNFGLDPENKQKALLRISDNKCNELINDLSRAVILSNIAGFDGVFIDASTNNIIGELSSEKYNKRIFGYYSNVKDFLTKALKQIDSKNNTIYLKLNINPDIFVQKTENNDSEKNNLQKLISTLNTYISLGVDGFEFVFGNYEEPYLEHFNNMQNEFMFAEIIQNFRTELNKREIKNKFGEQIQLFYHDNINDFKKAANMVKNSIINFVDITKNLYSDIDFIKKLNNKISCLNCIKCSYCNKIMQFNNKIKCVINPALLEFDKLNKNGNKKDVAIIGSGLSGMIAALVLVARDYNVHLYEQKNQINPMGKLMTVFNSDKSLVELNNFIEEQVREAVKHKKIQLFTSNKFTAQSEDMKQYYAIILATGFKTKLLSIVGAVQNHVYNIYDILGNQSIIDRKNNIIIYAKSDLSLKLAIFLVNNSNAKITLIIKDVEFIVKNKNANLFYYFKNLYKNGVDILFLSRILKINEDNIDVSICKDLPKNQYNSFIKIISNDTINCENFHYNLDCDLLIYEPEIIPNNNLYIDLVNSKFPNELYAVGNSLVNSDLSEIISSAYFVGKNL